MIKKIAISIGVILLLIIAALVCVPIFFKDSIKQKVIELANESLNAKVSFSDVSLSFFENFPNATVKLEDLSVINIEPFEGDTLVYAKELSAGVNVKDLIGKKENEPYSLKSFFVKNALVNVQTNDKGQANYDIAKETQEEEKDQQSTPISLKIDSYGLENVKIKYQDKQSNMIAVLDSLYHNGKGDFANEVLDLDTKTKTNITFVNGETKLLNNTKFALDAVLGLDLKNQKYAFKENKAYINKLELEFDGFVQLLEDGQKINLSFKTPTTTFKNFLDLVPQAYTKSMEGVQTNGSFTVDGKIDGVYSQNTIPKIDIKMLSKNASFKYPDLPKTVKNIDIDVKIGNETQKLDDTYVDVNRFAFSIDQDHFVSDAKLTNLLKNPYVKANAKGTINLENLTKAYPIDMKLDLKGILKADVALAMDMQSVEKKIYENIKSSGHASLEKFTYNGAGLIHPFNIEKAGLNFNTAKIQLTDFKATSGKSDFDIKGFIDNLYGFAFRNETLKGDFSLNSNTISVADFMQKTDDTQAKAEKTKTEEEQKTAQTAASQVKVPAFLDCTFNADIKKVLYDNLVLQNVMGKLIVKDQTVTLQNLQTDIFDGKIMLSGDVSTKQEKPKFNVKLDISKLNIVKSFKEMEMLNKIAPIANAIEGFIDTNIDVSGVLNSDFTPDLNTIKGNLGASLLQGKVKKDGTPLISKLDQTFPKIAVGGTTLKDIKANMTFDDGKINVAPFDVKLSDKAVVKLSGSHGFDQTMNYNIAMDVPPVLLGGEVEKVMSKLTATEQANLKNIPVSFTVTGNFQQPKVNVNLKDIATGLGTEIAKSQAKKAIDKGVDALSKDKNVQNALGQLGNLLGGKKDENKTTEKELTQAQKDSIEKAKKEEASGAVKNALKGLLKKKK